MTNYIEYENGNYGTKAIIKGVWHKTYLNILIDKDVQELELNDGKGWRGDNVDFIINFSNLKSLIIIDFNIKSIGAIHSLTDLENLEISTYCRTPIQFNAFPKLTKCSLEWRRGSDSLFEASNINHLFINNYISNDCDAFSELKNLKQLSILNSPVESIFGLSNLNNLKYLRLGNLKKLKSLHGLQFLHELEELEIQRCKGIFTISEVFQLYKLRRLLLVDLGAIASIVGLENLTCLKDFMFYESTNILDGNLFPLKNLSKLDRISFQNRKHYSHRREDFGEFLSYGLYLE